MKFLEKKLKKLGFKTRILEFKEKGFLPVKNLYARLGSKEPNFMFAGHVDIVPPGNIKDWTINPFRPSVKKGYLSMDIRNEIKELLIKIWDGFSIKSLDVEKFSIALSRDKKNVGDELRLILCKGYGEVFKDSQVLNDEFKRWLKEYFIDEAN